MGAKALRALPRWQVLRALPLYDYSQWIAQREYAFFRHVAFDQLVTPQTAYIDAGDTPMTTFGVPGLNLGTPDTGGLASLVTQARRVRCWARQTAPRSHPNPSENIFRHWIGIVARRSRSESLGSGQAACVAGRNPLRPASLLLSPLVAGTSRRRKRRRSHDQRDLAGS